MSIYTSNLFVSYQHHVMPSSRTGDIEIPRLHKFLPYLINFLRLHKFLATLKHASTLRLTKVVC